MYTASVGDEETSVRGFLEARRERKLPGLHQAAHALKFLRPNCHAAPVDEASVGALAKPVKAPFVTRTERKTPFCQRSTAVHRRPTRVVAPERSAHLIIASNALRSLVSPGRQTEFSSTKQPPSGLLRLCQEAPLLHTHAGGPNQQRRAATLHRAHFSV